MVRSLRMEPFLRVKVVVFVKVECFELQILCRKKYTLDR